MRFLPVIEHFMSTPNPLFGISNICSYSYYITTQVACQQLFATFFMEKFHYFFIIKTFNFA